MSDSPPSGPDGPVSVSDPSSDGSARGESGPASDRPAPSEGASNGASSGSPESESSESGSSESGSSESGSSESGSSESGPSDTAPASLTAGRRIPTTLDAIRAPVEDELGIFREYFRESMRSDNTLLDTVTQYVLRQKGKRIRPLLVLLSAKMCGGSITQTTYRAAALVELLHTATLVHDDVVDDAEKRRGVFSINALWKNKIAVLLGDFLLSRGLLLSLDHQDYDILHALSDAVRRMSEGELLQIEKARLLNIDEETYFDIISDKTASLIAACTKSGAISTSDDATDVEHLRRFGEKLGLAFQIRDDLFDFDVEDAGKPIGIDLQEKKMTLPLIAALREADRSTRRRIMKVVRKDDKDAADVETVTAFVSRYDGIAYAREKMQGFAAQARGLLGRFPPSDARDALVGLTEYTVARNR
jgi:octaprenyl-diphosphate synthase